MPDEPDINIAKSPPPPRRLTCERCGAAFTCDLGGHCWCMDEAVRLPLPATTDGGDCLCRDCLRAAAATRIAPA